MSGQSQMFDLPIWLVTPNATSSPASEDGPWPSNSPDGPLTVLSGPEAALANLSASQAKEQGLLTSGTYGHIGSILYGQSDLRQCLVSRLKQQLTTGGSILFKTTWKEKVTPSLRSVSLLRASGHRISDSGCGLWPTPLTVPDSEASHGQLSGSFRKALAKCMPASWPTTTANDSNRSPAKDFAPTPNMTLNHTAALAGWVTTTTRDWKDSPGMAMNGPDGRSRLDQLPRQAQLMGFGQTPTGSPAATASGGQLNPAHSRWLMGLPPEWDDCAPTATPSSRKSRRK